MSASRDIDAVIVLAGGFSRRLGQDKSALDWDGQPLLLHSIEQLSGLASGRVVVAARPGQVLPNGDYARVDDRRDGGGPLEGIATALRALSDGDLPWPPLPHRAWIAVCGCDYPFADPSLLRELASQGDDWDVVVPQSGGHLHPVHAVWRVGSVVACEEALDSGHRRVKAALDRLRVNVVVADTLGYDPSRTLLNVNDPQDLREAHRLLADQ